MKAIPFSLVGCGIVAIASSGLTREPTDFEQYYLELVNRARANPNGEVTRLAGEVWGDTGNPKAPSLNEGLAPGTISAAAKQPLAFDTRLIDAASAYSDLLLDLDQFSHTADGTALSRMTAAGYVFTAPSRAGENLATTASTGPHPINVARVDEHHEGLFIDGDVAGRGHRINLLHPDYREVGMAIREDQDGVSIFGEEFNEVLSTQNFATSAGRVFLTGVVYDDANSNFFYDPGESLGTLQLRVENAGGNQVASGSTFASGGYSLNLAALPAGSYTVFALNGLGAEAQIQFVWNGVANVKVDFIDPFTPFRPDALIGLSQAQLIGNGFQRDSPVLQSVAQTAKGKGSLSWQAAVENDGLQADDLILTGAAGNRFFRVTYLRDGGGAFINESAGLITGLVDNAVPTGTRTNYQITVSPNRSAIGKRTGFTAHLRVASNGDANRIDRVNAVLVNKTKKVKKPRR